MALVKATRRHSNLLLAALALLGAACDEARPTRAAMDCSQIIRKPVNQRISALVDDARFEPGDRCGLATCIAGNKGVFVWRDGDVVHATIGARTVDVSVKPTSPLIASRSMAGLMVGAHLLAVDRGDDIELFGEDGANSRVPMPTLRPRQLIGSLESLDGGLVASSIVRRDGDEPFVVLRPLAHPTTPARPAVYGAEGALLGFVERGEQGTVILVDDGHTRIDLGLSLSPHSRVASVGRAFYVRDGDRRHLVDPGHPPVPLIPSQEVLTFHDRTFALDTAPPGSIVEFAGGAFAPVIDKPFPIAGDATVLRHEIGKHDEKVLYVMRTQSATCETTDSVLLFDLVKKTTTTLLSDARMHMHPVWAGDRFRIIDADVESSTP